jgi:FemAB-related protein (PEP-CTERM system-associated)
LQIRIATNEDQRAWDGYVLGHPEGLAYQLFAWQQAVHSAYGFDHCYLLAENDGVLSGILPLIKFRIPFYGTRFLSLPYCDAGGVLANDEKISSALILFAREMADRLGVLYSLRTTQKLLPESINQTDKVRMLLDLPDSSERLLADLKAKLRSQIKRPLKDGLTVKLGGVELIDQFYAVFSENMRDLGSPVHSRSWIKSIVFHYQQQVKLSVVYTPEGNPAAAGIILLHPTTVSIPWASALRKYNRLNPNMLLYWTFLSFAADSGYQRFDFGRSTPGEGTYRFKEQWGAQPSPLYWYEFAAAEKPCESSMQEESLAKGRSGKRELAAQLWQKLPTAGANWLGPRIRKYISL